ncbi:hypothetical protein B0H14DRAFT_3164288 [Mycena olivaceomarginata]|nr:hypothetical protein B0H14DRAFT_3164288 [Mycena olivaceomarginata]
MSNVKTKLDHPAYRSRKQTVVSRELARITLIPQWEEAMGNSSRFTVDRRSINSCRRIILKLASRKGKIWRRVARWIRNADIHSTMKPMKGLCTNNCPKRSSVKEVKDQSKITGNMTILGGVKTECFYKKLDSQNCCITSHHNCRDRPQGPSRLDPRHPKQRRLHNPVRTPATTLVRINSQRVGPDGNLWLVDTGSPGFGSPVILPAGPKLVVVDLSTNQVKRVYNMANVTESASLLDDIRFNPATGMGYLTDAGVGALIVLDLDSGRAIRVLDGDESTGAFTLPSGEGTLLRSSTGVFSYVTADQLEVSPDGRYLHWQPASGGMFRIETQYLDTAFYNSSLANTLAQYIEPFALTPSTGGTSD